MADTRVQEVVPLSIDEAFEVYVNQINTWWPRQGIFPFSFAPKETLPLHIRFEPKQGGRFYEEFQDGTEYVIGDITKWDPPKLLIYTWKDPTWEGKTTITVTFTQKDKHTKVILEQSGFAEAGQPDLPPFYEIGNRQTLAGYVAHCTAIHEMKAFQ
jgi:uncharacterized protein YndB with AHSA1/START domain